MPYNARGQSDTSDGLVKELVAERFKKEWAVFLEIMHKYGKAYFGEYNISHGIVKADLSQGQTILD